ncbi:DNA oxidative demethylase AlkB [Oxalicibacterium faecigallinarum]|uniref:Alpha-ketoglutarate-dependent dioxygenase AlkB n=1 Tax=Oxalicibacterium faecigallinarum TaxID=573741 RepID=A0A8J3EZC2_9BURK|nr:DNA oxidative demethylase AlkB [Oxalicibacterium faecigallinarum]GGI16835.1 alpha-ketoglutarate-dependent dioxygenase AlkB [Oxalicibacterium faecigallinarum]
MSNDLFETDEGIERVWQEVLAEDALILRGYALAEQHVLLRAVDDVIREAPFRHLVTPGGFTMSVAMTNCGPLGWVSDRRGYRYDAIDPTTGKPWPAMPPVFLNLAKEAAALAGFDDFVPDACLINRYEVGTRLSLHQDRDEADTNQPIVSVSLGIPAIFQFGGNQRTDPKIRVPLTHGDVVVWGGRSRLAYHAVLPLKANSHPLTGSVRINLTFRKAR